MKKTTALAAMVFVIGSVGVVVATRPPDRPGRVWVESSGADGAGELLAIARRINGLRSDVGAPAWSGRLPKKWHPRRSDQVGKMASRFATTEVTKPIKHPTEERWAMPVDDPADVAEVRRILSECGIAGVFKPVNHTASCARAGSLSIVADSDRDPSWADPATSTEGDAAPPDDEDGGQPF